MYMSSEPRKACSRSSTAVFFAMNTIMKNSATSEYASMAMSEFVGMPTQAPQAKAP